MQNKVAGYPDCVATAKDQAKRLSLSKGGKRNLSRAQALEMVANLHGVATWAEMLAGFQAETRKNPDDIDEKYFLKFPEMLFSYSDYYCAAERLGMSDDLWKHFVSDGPTAFRSISENTFISTHMLGELKEKILDLFRLRVDLHGGAYCFDNDMSPETMEKAKSGPIALGRIGRTMIRDAGGIISGKEKCVMASRAFFRHDGTTPRKDYEFGLQFMQEIKEGRRPTQIGDLPEINNQHSILIASDPEKWISSLTASHEKGVVVNLFSKDTLDDLADKKVCFKGEGEFHEFASVYPQSKAVNPVEIVKRMVFERNYKNPLGIVFIVSARDLSMTQGGDILLACARSAKVHIVIVADMMKIKEDISRHVDHVWRPEK